MMTVVGFDRPTIEKAMDLVETYDFLYASVGWHPVDAIDMRDADLKWIEEVIGAPEGKGHWRNWDWTIIGISLRRIFSRKCSENRSASLKR